MDYFIFQITVTLVYLGWIVLLYGIQPSISDSFRVLQNKYGEGSLMPWLFWLFLINASWPLWALMQPLGTAFFAMAGIILVGAAAKFWKSTDEKPHIIGATGGFVLAFISFGISYGWAGWIFMGIALLTTLLLKYVNIKRVNGKLTFNEVSNYTWWVECQAMFLIFLFEGIFII